MNPLLAWYVLYRKGGMVDRGAYLPLWLEVLAASVSITAIVVMVYIILSMLFA